VISASRAGRGTVFHEPCRSSAEEVPPEIELEPERNAAVLDHASSPVVIPVPQVSGVEFSEMADMNLMAIPSPPSPLPESDDDDDLYRVQLHPTRQLALT